MVYKSDKTRCNLTGSALSRERLGVVRSDFNGAQLTAPLSPIVRRAPLKCARATLRTQPFSRYRAPQNVTTRMRALRKRTCAPLRESLYSTPLVTDVYDRPAARALGGSMNDTQGVESGARGRLGSRSW
eukprot:2410593-Prymnesium_polylepis.1